MTNREYINTLSNEQLANYVYDVISVVGKDSTDSRKGVAEWLDRAKDSHYVRAENCKIEDKINELVAFANGLEKSMKECTVIQLNGEKVVSSAEPTEKMYTLDEVAEMLYHYDVICYGVCGLWNMPKYTAGFCKQHSCGGQCKNPVECWKHAIQSGWLKGEEDAKR